MPPSYGSIVTEIITFESGSNLRETLENERKARRIATNDIAIQVLQQELEKIVGEDVFKNCWTQFQNGRSMTFEVSGLTTKWIDNNSFELSVDTTMIAIPDGITEVFKVFCSEDKTLNKENETKDEIDESIISTHQYDLSKDDLEDDEDEFEDFGGDDTET